MGLQYSDIGRQISRLWFLDSRNYDTYDDFTSYSAGAFSSNSKWTVTGSASIVDSPRRLRISVGAGGTSTVATATDFVPGKSYYIYVTPAAESLRDAATCSGLNFSVRVNGGSYTDFSAANACENVFDGICSFSTPTALIAHYNENNLWDIWVGGKKLFSDLSSITSIQFRIVFTTGGSPAGGGSIYLHTALMSKIFFI